MISTTNKKFPMNSLAGKQILAIVRKGNYAHAGEEEAIARRALLGDRFHFTADDAAVSLAFEISTRRVKQRDL